MSAGGAIKMELEKKKKALINIAFYAVILGIFYLFLKYAFWLFFPIIFSFLVATVLQKPVNTLSKRTPLKKGASSVVCVFLLLFILGSVIVLLGASAVNYLKSFIEYVRDLFDNADDIADTIRVWLLNIADKLPDGISKILSKNITEIFESIKLSLSGEGAEIASETVKESTGLSFDFSWLASPLSSVMSTAKQIPSILLSVVITLVMSCFLTSDYDTVSGFIVAQLSDKRKKDLARAKYLLKTSFLKILKAYALIILITFVEMLIGLTVLKLIGVYKSGYIVIIAAATAVVDIFPVLGTGTVIFPWAAYSAIVGNYGMAIGLVVIYAAISVIRQIIEPKLVAGQLGLPPFLTIIGMFVGLKLFGFIGMLIMPILIIMMKLLNDEGIIRLWKSPVKLSEDTSEDNGDAETKEKSGQESSGDGPSVQEKG